MLMGRYDYALDAKNRINIPAKFRAEMGNVLYITKWFDNCLAVYGREQWAKMDAKFEGMPVAKAKNALRIIYGSVTEVETDKQGRVVISQFLKEHANLDKDVVIIGTRDHLEIWDKAAHAAMEAANDFDTFMDLEF